MSLETAGGAPWAAPPTPARPRAADMRLAHPQVAQPLQGPPRLVARRTVEALPVASSRRGHVDTHLHPRRLQAAAHGRGHVLGRRPVQAPLSPRRQRLGVDARGAPRRATTLAPARFASVRAARLGRSATRPGALRPRWAAPRATCCCVLSSHGPPGARSHVAPDPPAGLSASSGRR